MATVDTVSLFSLEIAVDYLRVDAATVTCRLPAVAIRLLDFPTLLIPSLDKNEQDRFKTAVLFDSYGKLPLKFKDLMDSRGNFQFNKGKSCMFKFDLVNLYDLLQNVPLYVMITDIWSEDAPKLVGICTIPLSDIISYIRKEVQLKGISHPSVHGQNDVFPVFNLMGSQVGVVSLGYRLLSLGASLIPHIPSTSILQGKSQEQDQNKEEFYLSLLREQKLSQQPEETMLDVNIQHGHSSPQRHAGLEGSLTPGCDTMNDDKWLSGNSGLIQDEQSFFKKPSAQSIDGHQKQTRSNKCRKENGRINGNTRICIGRDFDSLIELSNTHCPPPLIFNAQWDSHDSKGMPLASGPEVAAINAKSDFIGYDASLQSESSESYHSKTLEVHYGLHNDFPDKVRKIVRGSNGRSTPHLTSPLEEKSLKKANGRQENVIVPENDSLKALPILTAFLQELSILTGAKSKRSFCGAIEEFLMDGKENIQPSKVEESQVHDNIPACSARQEHASSHHSNQSCRHKLCAKPPKPVPSAKGWLRQEPVFRKRESKLHFKMTYSQKLRLKMNNPELLKTIEAEEEKHSMMNTTSCTQRKTRTQLKKSRSVRVAKSSSRLSLLRHPPDNIPVEAARRDTVYSDTNRNLPWKAGTASPLDRPPVPTPRKSLTAEEQSVMAGSEQYDREDALNEVTEDSHHEITKFEDNDFNASEKSARSIEVFIPKLSLSSSDTDGGSEAEKSDHDQTGIPGFPTESFESTDEGSVFDRVSKTSSYSQEFESAHGGSDSYSNESMSSYHTPRYEDQSPRGIEKQERSEVRGSTPESATPQFTSESGGSVLVSAKSSMSWSPETPLDNNESGDERQTEIGKQEGQETAKDGDAKRVKGTQRTRGVVSQLILSGLALPRPLVASTSPVPQPRHPKSKIVMSKPLSVNDSGEVNLPSDLSASFHSPPGASQDVMEESHRMSQAKDDVNDEYSEDFLSDLEDTDEPS